MGRVIDKVDKYLQKACDQYVESTRSIYYRLGGKIIRVSDHIGTTSDGTYHIIVKPNGYLIHHPQTGTINIVTYEQVKEFIRVFRLFPFADLTNQPDVLEDKRVEKAADTILGVPVDMFTPGQLNVIKQTAKKAMSGQNDTLGDAKKRLMQYPTKAEAKKVQKPVSPPAPPAPVKPAEPQKPVKPVNIDTSVLD